jgi:hypothetical protein
VSDSRQTPSGDASFRSSLTRQLAGAAGVVVLGAATFWVVGSVGGGDETPVVAEEPAPGPAEPEEDVEAEVPGEADDAAPEVPDEDADADEGQDADADAVEDAVDEDAVDEGDDGDDGDEGDEGDDGTDDEGARDVDPSSVTVQVLDGFKTDGGAAADSLTDQLEGAGYSVVARNDALSYASTTVLFNPGYEAAAQQVAAELGGAVVSEQPGNLSTAVELHVVVGADRG